MQKTNILQLLAFMAIFGLFITDALSTFTESFEDTEIGQMPPAGWRKWEEAGGRGWSNSWAGRQPMPGWMSGTNSTPPGGGDRMAYVTYTHGGSKTNDLWLISPQLKGITATSSLSFWYNTAFSNFADSLNVMISTNPDAYRKSDFTIEAYHASFPRGYVPGAPPGNKRDFGPWTNIILNIGSMVPAGTDIRIGFQEYWYNNWYDVRAIQLDLIQMDLWGVPILSLDSMFRHGPFPGINYNIAYDGSSPAESGLCWGPNDPPTIHDNKINEGQGAHSTIFTNLPADGIQYFRAYVDNNEGTFYSSNTFMVYPGGNVGEGYCFESFEDTPIGEMPPSGWKKWEEAGGRGWSNSWAGRQPMPGWMSGTNNVPPAEGAGSRMAYVTYTHGGSKTNDNWLISPRLKRIPSNYNLSFWYNTAFSNFADNLYVWVSTHSNAYRKSHFSIQALHESYPRGYVPGAPPGNKRDFGPWTNHVIDLGALVPEGSDIYVGFQEYYYNNWYDVRASQLDCITLGSKVRNGLLFDGVDDRAIIPLGSPPTAYTIETWVKPYSTGAQNIMSRSDTNPLTGYSQQLRINASGQFEHYVYDGAEKTVTGSTVVQSGKWYHVAGSAKNSNTLKLYVNGVEEGSPATIGTMVLTDFTNVYLGASTDAGSYPYFHGVLDEVRFWSNVRQSNEIATTMNNYLRGTATNLTACYRLDRTFGSDLFDSSANHHDCWMETKTNSTVWQDEGYYFDGVADVLSIPELTQPPNYAIELWVKPLQSGAQNIIAYTEGDPLTSYSRQLRINSSGQFEFYSYDGSARLVTGTTVISNGTWYHVAGTAKNGGNMDLYVNGALENSGLAGNTLWGTGVAYQVGTQTGGGSSWFEGYINEIVITNYYKTAPEIEYAYTNTLGDASLNPQWIASEAPLGDSLTADQWHNRGLWEQQQDGVTITNGLAIDSSVSGMTNFIVFGDNNLTETSTNELPSPPGGARLSRYWYADVHGQPTQTADMTFSPELAGASDFYVSLFESGTNTYRLLRRSGSSGEFSVLPGTANAVSGNSITFSNVDLSEGYYSVAIGPPDAPHVLAATNETGNSFDANWEDISIATNFFIDVSTSPTFSSFISGYQNFAIGDVLTTVVTGLTSSSTYYYRLRSEFLGVSSTNSATITANTLTEGSIGLTTATLSWTLSYSTPSDTTTYLMTNHGQIAYSYTNIISYGSSSNGWLSIMPPTGTVEALSVQACTASVSSAGLPVGTYYATNTIQSIDATNSPVIVPVSLTIEKADQSITFPDPGPQFTTNEVGLSVDASSGLAVALNVDSGPGSLSGGTNLSFSAAGDVVVTASQSGDSNWNAAPSVTHTITVTKALASVSLNNLSQTYDGTARTVTASTTPGGLTVDITYDGNTWAPTNAGTYTVVGLINEIMYQGGRTDSLVVAKADQTVSFPAISDQTYTSTVELTATATSGLGVNFAVESGPGSITSDTNLSFTATGTVSIVASQGGDTNWNAAPSVTNTFLVSKADQAISFPMISNQLTTNTVSISANANSGLNVSFSILSGPAVLAGPTSPTSLTFTNAGTVIIAAHQPGSNYWNAAPSVTNTFSVTKVAGTVTLTDLTHVYDGSEKYPTDQTDPTNLSVIITYDGFTNRPINAGSYEAIGTIADAYYEGAATNTFTISQATQTITFPPLPDQVITNQVGLAASASSGLPVSLAVNSGPASIAGGTNLSFSNVGDVQITADQAGDSNYLAAATITNIFSVAPVQPAIDTPTVSNILSKTASLGATITATNGAPITERGVFWNTGGTNVLQSLETGAFGTGAFSLNVTGIVAGVTNYFQAYAENVSGRVYTAESSFLAIPDAPAMSPASATNTYDFAALWNSAIGATNYLIDVATDGGFASILPAYDARVLGSITTFSVTGLTEGTTYFYRMRSENAQGISTNSAMEQVTTYTEGAIGLTPTEFTLNAIYGGTNPAMQTCTVTNFGETGYTFTNEISYGEPITGWLTTLPISDALGPHGTLIITSAVDIAALNAGTYHATNAVTSPTATNAPQSVRATLVVAPASQSISFPTIPDQVITGLVGLAATGGASTNPVTFSVLSGPASIAGGTNLSFSNVGEIQITADQAGDSNYLAAATITNTFSVAPVQPAIDSPTVSNILSKTASLGATITATNGAPVSERGVFWNSGGTNVFQSLETGTFGTGAFSLNVTGIVAGVTNYFQAYAENTSGRVYTAMSSFLAIPDAPEMLPASATNTYDFTALWNSAIGSTNYLIDVATDGGFASILPAYDARVLGSITTLSVTGLTEGTTYFYRLRGQNAQGISTNSAMEQVTTYTEGAIGLTPTEFTFNAIYSGTNPAMQTCTVTNFGETGYVFTNEISYGEPITGWLTTLPISDAIGPHGTLIITSAVDIAALNAGTYHATNAVTSPTATNAPQAVRATLVVAPASQSISFPTIPDQVITGLVGLAATGGASTNPVTFSVLSGPASIAGDTNLSFSNVGEVLITADQAGDSNYLAAATITNIFSVAPVQPAIDSPTVSNILSKTASLGATITATNGAPVTERGVLWNTGGTNVFQSLETGAFGTGAFSLNVTGIVAGVTNYFQAYAENTSGRVYTAESSFLAIPDAPAMSPASATNTYDFTALWSSAIGATNYLIDVATDGGFASILPAYNARVLGDITTLSVTGLTEGTPYFYRLRSENAQGISTNSVTEQVTTYTEGAIGLTPTEFTFNAIYGGTNPAMQTCTVTNLGETGYIFTNAISYGEPITGWLTTLPITEVIGPHSTLIITSAVDIAALNAGTYHATNSVASPTATNAPQSVRATMVVAPATQTISFPAIPNQVITGLAGLTASGGASTNPVTFAVLSGPASIAGGTNLSFSNVGEVQITADQAGDSNYLAAATITNTFSVAPVQPAIDSPTVSNILSKTASLGATITATNGAPVTERGVFWNSGGTNVFQSLETGTFGTGAFSLNVTGIVAGVTNYFQAYAENVSGRVYTVESSFLAISDAPEALPASLTNTYDVTAIWNSAVGATNYLLDVATDSGFSSILPAYDARVLGDITTFTVTGLTEGTTCFYRMRSENAQGISTNSATEQVTTYTEGAIGLTPTEFTFNAIYSGTNPAMQTCTVTNFGETGYVFTNEISYGEPITGWLTTLPITDAIGPHGTLIITSAVDIAALNAGTYHATNSVTSPTATNAPQSVRATLVVAPATQQISFAPIPDQVVTGLVGLAATGGASTNPVTFSVLSGPASIAGGTNLSFSNVGEIQITADQAGDSNYLAAATITNIFSIAPVQPAIDSPTVSNILSKTASLGATITATNGAPVTERGVFWNSGGTNVFQSLETGAFGTGAFSLNVTGIVAGVTNYFQAYAENVSGRVYTAESSFLAIPDAPEMLPASATNTYDFTAQWNSAIGATNFLIDVATDGGFASILPAYDARVLGSISTLSITGLTEGTTYFYRMRSENAQGISTNSATEQVTTYTEGAIGLTPTEFTFNAIYGGTNPAMQTCTVTNFGETGYVFTNEISYGEPITGWLTTLPITDAIGPHGTLIITSAVDIAALNAGTYHATNSVASPTATNAPQSVRATLVVAPAAQQISFAPIPDQVVTGLVGLAASGGASTNPIIFNVLSGPASIAGGTNLSFINVGEVQITADQAGDSNYLAAATFTNIFSVAPVQPAIDSPTVSNILSKTASLGATITATNGAPVSERGVFWNTGGTNVFQSLETGAFGTGAFSLNVTGIVAGVTNYFQAYAENISGRVYTAESSFLAVPDAPEVSQATNIQADAFYANWNAAIGATNYYIDVSETNTFSSYVPGYDNCDAGNETSISVTGLGSSVFYYYRVRSLNNQGLSTNSAVLETGLMLDLIISALPVEHDTPAPLGYGTNKVIVYTTVTNEVTTPTEESNGVRYACTGWSGTGDVPPTGTANTVTFLFTTDSSLTWHWKTQYELTQSADGGTIEGLSNGWQDAGWIFDLVPVANNGHIFKRWRTNGVNAGSSKLLTVVAESPIAIEAIFTSTAWDVDTQGSVTMTGYRIDPYSGLCYCTFEVCNPSGSATVLRDRFLYAMDPDAMTFLDNPDGVSPSGKEYKNVTAEVKSKLQAVGNHDQVMDPGECVDLNEIAFWTRNPTGISSYFYSRGLPDMTGCDTDGDGIPNDWEDQEGLNKNNPVDANKDQDNDGVISDDEYVADTNPFDAHSFLHIYSIIPTLTNGEDIGWIGGTGVIQDLEWAPDMTGTWIRIQRFNPPTPSTNEWMNDPTQSPGFYRIKATR